MGIILLDPNVWERLLKICPLQNYRKILQMLAGISPVNTNEHFNFFMPSSYKDITN